LHDGRTAENTLLTDRMTVAEFLDWPADPNGQVWQLIDGEPVAMAPASETHGSIQSEIVRLFGNHLLSRKLPCRVITAPGVSPRVHAESNVRVPDLAVACKPGSRRERLLAEPVLVVEILSPSNEQETWEAIWAYTTIPSVQDILVVRSLEVGAELLTGLPDGNWPAAPSQITGRLRLGSIDGWFEVPDFYANTDMAQPPGRP